MKPKIDITDPTTLTPGINWDRNRLRRFKKAFARAVWSNTMSGDKSKTSPLTKNGLRAFTFDGKEYLMSFAGYLIEKLDERLNGTKKS